MGYITPLNRVPVAKRGVGDGALGIVLNIADNCRFVAPDLLNATQRIALVAKHRRFVEPGKVDDALLVREVSSPNALPIRNAPRRLAGTRPPFCRFATSSPEGKMARGARQKGGR